ncbi:hypothetical protein WI41_06065 [Burkholderia latens]|uniref:Uncharacterized protein n=1 Tax=Burkholderia latens TaxID=488446 RepID=A0AAP1C7D7_9BURK|nr:hypothetical protein WI41_06065 [Burkholderia latens]
MRRQDPAGARRVRVLGARRRARSRRTRAARIARAVCVYRESGRANRCVWVHDAERRTPNAERRTPNAERRTPNAERRTPT